MSDLVEQHRAAPAPPWLEAREQGSSLGIRFFIRVLGVLGRPFARLFLGPVVAYYVVTRAAVRRASREWLARIGASAGAFAVYRHVLRFGQCALDRVLLAQGEIRALDVTLTGHEHLQALADTRRGAILLGAHLGSFEAMRAQSQVKNIDIHVVVNSQNARLIASALRRLGPGVVAKTVELSGDDGLGAMLRIRELVDSGSLVAILGDRLDPDGRFVEVPFLGAPARLPAGPYLLAAALGCPMYLTFGLYRGGSRYDLYCEPFADRVMLPRASREEALVGYASEYASRLEHYARMAPDNWFNFYEFWRRS